MIYKYVCFQGIWVCFFKYILFEFRVLIIQGCKLNDSMGKVLLSKIPPQRGAKHFQKIYTDLINQ